MVFKEGVWYLKRECGIYRGRVVFKLGYVVFKCVVFKEGVWYLKWACGTKEGVLFKDI